MIEKILVASLACGALALDAPAAPAAHTMLDCRFDAVAQQDVTGGEDTFRGAAYGYVVSPTPGESVEIVCYVTVNGTAVTPTDDPAASGTNVDTFASEVTYTASDTDEVELCADWTAGPESGSLCFEGLSGVSDDLAKQIDEFFTDHVDPLLCRGAPHPDGAPNDGDVYVFGFRVYDCPPFGD